jgi:hypothetical protein
MSDDQLAKKRAELEHLRSEATVLKEAMMPEQAAQKLYQFMANRVDPFNDSENEWVRDKSATCANCALM